MELHNDNVRGWRPGTAHPLAGLMLNVHDWTGAACATVQDGDRDLWFSVNAADRIEAAARCEWCPLRVRCLETALENDEHAGVWGGFHLGERTALRAATAWLADHRRDAAA